MKINVDFVEKKEKKKKRDQSRWTKKENERIHFLDNSALRGICRSDVTR